MTTSGFMGRLGQRWDRRQETYLDGREPFTAQSVVRIAARAQEVWDFLDAPGAAVLLDHRHIRSFPVPGTPEQGVGHQYCSMRHDEDGTLLVTVSEIIEHDPPWRVVRRILNTMVPIVEAHTVAELPVGCSYALSLGLRIPAGTSKRVASDIQKELDECTAKVKALVESGLTLTPSASAPGTPAAEPHRTGDASEARVGEVVD